MDESTYEPIRRTRAGRGQTDRTRTQSAKQRAQERRAQRAIKGER